MFYHLMPNDAGYKMDLLQYTGQGSGKTYCLIGTSKSFSQGFILNITSFGRQTTGHR
jgi:hypothetical protein